METHSEARRRELESLDRGELEQYQLERLNRLLESILPQNRFYAEKLAHCPEQLETLDQLQELPPTSKEELLWDEGQLTLPKNLTWPT